MIDQRELLLKHWIDANKPVNKLGQRVYPTMNDVMFTESETWLQNNCNARCKMKFNPDSDIVTGEVLLNYNRVSIITFLKGVIVPGKASDYINNQYVAKALRDKLGIPIIPEEINPTPITNGMAVLQPTFRGFLWLPTYSVSLSFEKT